MMYCFFICSDVVYFSFDVLFFICSDIVKALLRYDASPCTSDNNGCYPLHLAAWSGNTSICQTLLKHGTVQVNHQVRDG